MNVILCPRLAMDYVSRDQIFVRSAQVLLPIRPRAAAMPGHVLAHVLDTDLLSADERDRFRALMLRERVDTASLLLPGAQAPMRWFREACPDMDAEQAACLGYFAGEQARLTSYSVLTTPLISAGSVSEVLRLLSFIPLIANVLRVSVVERDDAVAVLLAVDSGDPVLDRIPVYYCVAALVHLLRLLLDQPPELVVHIAWPGPDGLADHPECRAGRLRFNAPMHYITVPRDTLTAVCRFSDPIAYQNAVAGLEAMLRSQILAEDLPGRVRQLIEAQGGLLPLEAAAAALNLSASTLKRRLTEAGTCYSDILAGTLRDRAMLQLADARVSLDAIATALGYSDLANFSHAFKRWTGHSPGEFRRTLRDDSLPLPALAGGSS